MTPKKHKMKSITYYFKLMSLLIGCGSNAQISDPIPNHKTLSIQSKILGETRLINIWTPPTYDTGDSLPVLIMLDGGIKEDFPHLANTLAKLIATKEIPPTILVAIENTERRRDLTGPTNVAKDKEIAPLVGESANFRNFIKTEVIPEIQKKYHTTTEKGIIGESLAGLFVTETLLIEPELFDYYIAFDPSLWWNNADLVKKSHEHLAKLPSIEKRFWFAGSKEKEISSHTKVLAQILSKESLPFLKWHYADEPKEKHNTIFRATKEKALIWTMNRKQN